MSQNQSQELNVSVAVSINAKLRTDYCLVSANQPFEALVSGRQISATANHQRRFDLSWWVHAREGPGFLKLIDNPSRFTPLRRRLGVTVSPCGTRRPYLGLSIVV